MGRGKAYFDTRMGSPSLVGSKGVYKARLRCEQCSHTRWLTAANIADLEQARATMRNIGADLEGPFCKTCHAFGRGDVLLEMEFL